MALNIRSFFSRLLIWHVESFVNSITQWSLSGRQALCLSMTLHVKSAWHLQYCLCLVQSHIFQQNQMSNTSSAVVLSQYSLLRILYTTYCIHALKTMSTANIITWVPWRSINYQFTNNEKRMLHSWRYSRLVAAESITMMHDSNLWWWYT